VPLLAGNLLEPNKEEDMKNRLGLIVAATFLVVAAPATLPASDGAATPAEAQPNWGPTWNIVHTIGSGGFTTLSSSSAWSTDARAYRWSSTGGAFLASLPLPAGALIVALELEACDDGAGGYVQAMLMACPHRGSYDCDGYGVINTGTSETPGCDGFFAAVDPPQTVDNLVNTYMLYVLSSPGIDFRFLSVLVSYRLQISPAPVIATFPDVDPSYWAFQEIEALAASGITTGFPDGTFRPTNAVTRAQMATFLARALGLHWAY
jgi:hypothetical protein